METAEHPELGVGFGFDLTEIFGQLKTLDDIFGKSAADAIRQWEKVKKATGGGLLLAGSTAEITAYGNAADRTGRDAARAFKAAEAAAEAHTRKIERLNETMGMTTAEMGRYRAGQAAIQAAEVGAVDALAGLNVALSENARLRTAAAEKAEREAQATRDAAFAHSQFELAAKRGMAAYREQQQAQAAAEAETERLAAAGLRLRASIDPAFAAQQRFDREMAEARTLISANAISLDDYVAKLRMERGALDAATSAQVRGAEGAKSHGAAMAGLSFQAQDAFTQISMGANPLSVLAIQGGQAAGQMIYMEGALGSVANFMLGPWGLALTAGALALGALWEHHKKATEEAEKHKKAMGDGAVAADGLGGATKGLTGAIDLLNQAQLNDKTNAIAAAARSAAAARIEQANATVAAAKATGMLELAAAKQRLSAAEGKRDNPEDMRSPLARIMGVAPGSTRADAAVRRGADADVARAQAQVAKIEGDFKRLDTAFGNFRTRVVGQAISSDGQIRESHLKLLTATGALDRAQAQHDSTVRRARIELDAGTLSEVEYARQVRVADAALKGVEDATKRATDARRGHTAATAAATKAAREQAAAEKELFAWASKQAGSLSATGLIEQQRKAQDAAKRDFATMFGDDPAFGEVEARAKASYDEMRAGVDQRAQERADGMRELTDHLRLTADLADQAGAALSRAFGRGGDAIGQAVSILGAYGTEQQRIATSQLSDSDKVRAQQALQLDSLTNLAGAAKGMFAEHSAGYRAMEAAEKALAAWRAIQTVRDVAAGAAKMFASLGPFAFPAVAAMVAVMAGFGISGGGGGSTFKPTSSEDLQKAAGTGTVFGSADAKSASIARSLDLVAKNTSNDLLGTSEMIVTLKSIDSSIGAMAGTVAKQINVSGSLFDTDKLGLGQSGSAGFVGLFASSTTRSLYDAGITLAATTVGDIVARGISGQTYQIVEQVKKKSGFLGIGGGTKTTYSTTAGGLPSDIEASIQSVIGALENGIVAAAGTIGVTGAKAMLDGFEVNIGKLSFAGLDAKGIEDQLNAVFSSVGDRMTAAVLPSVGKFQVVGEGLFETLERVASTVLAVDAGFKKLGRTTTTMGVDVDMGIASRFDSVSDLVSATDRYFTTFYSSAEQAAAKAAQLGSVFEGMGLTVPATLASYRQLVEAQDFASASGQATYATLLQLAPAFAEVKAAMEGAKSAADVLAERQDLERRLLELSGDTVAIRAMDLAKLDASNRSLQQQVWVVQDAQKAADAAQQLRDAWTSVGDSIADEVKRIRGLSGVDTAGGFASLQGRFNAATLAARGGDQEMAKALPGLSQALLAAAAGVATSRQELDRIQAMTASSLETTKAALDAFSASATPSATSTAALLAAAATAQATSTPAAANDDMREELRALREELAGMRTDNNRGHAATASNTSSIDRRLNYVTAQSGGDAVSVMQAA